MGLHSHLSEADNFGEVDVIIAGGGSAGCIIASRLADADRGLSILVIEGGATNDNVMDLMYPAFMVQSLGPESIYNHYYKAVPSEALGNRELVVPTGGVLGGGSSVNLMVYTRAQRSDFDSWGMDGWGAVDMLPYMRKLETYHGPDEAQCHGSDGPIQVSGNTFRSLRLEDSFVDTAKDLGWPEIPDLQTMDANNGVQRAMRYVDSNGKRQDTAHRYLLPRIAGGKHPNLHALLETEVVRVVLENQVAVGVECQPNSSFQKATSLSTQTIRAKKMIIISCGALGSPLILERSGIGDSKILEAAGIRSVTDLPGVGRDYQDHQMMVYSYKSCLTPEETLDSIVCGRVSPQELVDNNASILGWNGIDAYCKIRPNDSEIPTIGPEFEETWKKDFRDLADRPLMMASLCACFPGDSTELPGEQFFSIAAFTPYPYSRGHIHVTGPTLKDVPNFDTGFFSDPHGIDIKKHLWFYKKQREVARRMTVFRGELEITHPQFPPTSKSACVDGALQPNAPDVEYDDQDDRIIESWLRHNVGTTWHSMGTCKMAPHEEGGVVDHDLNVYGVRRLKVIDLSVPPVNMAANTNNTAMAIGEKGAAICIKELGLGL
ncbi:GMC oxidoreductase-domain-containing protein [Ustulina deusta]|nr:GMC oxidoreductase-domain-containing protein [Ustulina deusta]